MRKLVRLQHSATRLRPRAAPAPGVRVHPLNYRKGGSQSEQAAFLGYWMRRFSVRFAAGVATVMTRRWARFSGRSYAAGELEFGAFYAETGAAPGTAPGDLQHGGV